MKLSRAQREVLGIVAVLDAWTWREVRDEWEALRGPRMWHNFVQVADALERKGLVSYNERTDLVTITAAGRAALETK